VIFFQLVLGDRVIPTTRFPRYYTAGWGRNARIAYNFYMIHTYRQIFAKQRYHYGIALLWMLFIVVIILTLIVL
jgi:multiple sugar transport system permease protein